MRGKSRCEDCQFFDYDEETDSNYCTQDLDEDEMERFSWSWYSTEEETDAAAAALRALAEA